MIAGIGQGYMLATPLQLAQMAATIATRGKRFALRLVKRIRDVRTGETQELPPEPMSSIEVKDAATGT